MFARFKAAYARNDLDACVTLLSQLKVRAAGPAGSVSPAVPFPLRSSGSSGGFRGGCSWVGFHAGGMEDAIFIYLWFDGSEGYDLFCVSRQRRAADPVTPARWVSPCFGRFPFGSRVSSHPSPIGLHSAAGNGEKGRIFSSFS